MTAALLALRSTLKTPICARDPAGRGDGASSTEETSIGALGAACGSGCRSGCFLCGGCCGFDGGRQDNRSGGCSGCTCPALSAGSRALCLNSDRGGKACHDRVFAGRGRPRPLGGAARRPQPSLAATPGRCPIRRQHQTTPATEDRDFAFAAEQRTDNLVAAFGVADHNALGVGNLRMGHPDTAQRWTAVPQAHCLLIAKISGRSTSTSRWSAGSARWLARALPAADAPRTWEANSPFSSQAANPRTQPVPAKAATFSRFQKHKACHHCSPLLLCPIFGR